MRSLVSRLLLRVAVCLAGGAFTAASADAAIVTGTFKYLDTTSGACALPIPPPNCGLQPIAFARIEIWHHGTMFWDVWAKVGDRTTDSTGRFSFSDTRSSGTYAVRVYATNYAAAVSQNGEFYVEPGFPGANIQKSVAWSGQQVDFSYNFTDTGSRMYYNVAETIRRGFDYARVRRDPNETDPLPRANVTLTESTGNPNNVSWYNPLTHTVVLHTNRGMDDTTILHEYTHWLEAQLSSFAWIASSHDGCAARDIWGNIMNSPEHAWMEGFATYFAHAVMNSLPNGTFSMWGRGQVESPGECTVATPDAIEGRITASLWDLIDAPGASAGALDEPHDFMQGLDSAILQIFDRELDVFGTSPTIWDFRNAWGARGLDLPGLDRILSHHGILWLPDQTAQFISMSVPLSMTPGQTALASVTMRNTGITTWTPAALHRLGSQSPQDNMRWGLNRVALPAAVPPGGQVTFSFNVTAPSVAGTYSFQWRMVQDAVEWFGDFTRRASISVITDDGGGGGELCFDPEIRKYVPCLE